MTKIIKNFFKPDASHFLDRLSFGMLLTFIGGFMDVYSYIVRGNVFATGQTGNFVLMAVHLAERNIEGVFHATVPIISFWIGNFVALSMLYSLSKENKLKWKHSILVTEIIILFITGFIPVSYPDIIANSLLSFAASLQYCTFRKLGTEDAYASVFCTGNMRSCAENYYRGIVQKNKKSMEKAIRYSFILLAFFLGVITGALGVTIFHEKVIWCTDLILIAVLILSYPAGSNHKSLKSASDR